jgi:superfamily II DNA/RNA helicase
VNECRPLAPGRLMEHFMYDDALAKSFSKLRCLVLDEADRLLDPGFEAGLTLVHLSAQRKHLLWATHLHFSACREHSLRARLSA